MIDPRGFWYFTNKDSFSYHHESDHHGVVVPNSRHILRINFPEGKVKEGMSLMNHTQLPEEKEILLGRGRDLILHPRPSEVDDIADSKAYIWDAYPSVKSFSRKDI